MKKVIIILVLCLTYSSTKAQLNLRYTTEDGLSSNRVYALEKDDMGFIWFLTIAGYDRFDGTEFRHFDFEQVQKLPIEIKQRFSKVADKKGVLDRNIPVGNKMLRVHSCLWKIDFPKGVTCTYENYPTFEISNDIIAPNTEALKTLIQSKEIIEINKIPHPVCALRAQNGTLYIGTANDGLYVVENTEKKNYRKENSGLISSTILSLVEDQKHTIVMSTDYGLARYNPDSGTFFHWLPRQGIPNNGFMENCAFIKEDGTLVFGMHDGCIMFADSVRIPRSYYSNMIFTDIQAGDSILDDYFIERSLKLKYDQRRFSLKISNICFDNPHEFLYQWHFSDGLDTWTKPTRDRTIQYWLQPGKYTLTVRCISSDDMTIISEKKINIEVEEPWWWTWQAKGIYIVLFFVAIFMAMHIITIWNKRKSTIGKLQLLLKNNNEHKPSTIVLSAPEYTPPTNNDFLIRVNQVLQENVSNSKLSVDDLCKASFMSRTSFFNHLKEATGYSPLDFIRVYRMEHAKHLLENTKMPISNVAYDCGYSDPKYFSDVFRKYVGTSPSEWRKKVN